MTSVTQFAEHHYQVPPIAVLHKYVLDQPDIGSSEA